MTRTNASQWWSEDVTSDDRSRLLLDHVRQLEQAQRPMFNRVLQYAFLYDRNGRFMGSDRKIVDSGQGNPSTENIIRNNIETATALLGNEQTRVAALTDGAEWSVQRRAKRLEKFLEAMFTQIGWDPLLVRMVRSAGVAGNGYLRIEVDDGKIRGGHVPFDEIIVDDEASRAGPPVQLAQRRFVDKDVLKAKYPAFEQQIDRAHTVSSSWTLGRVLQPNQIVVIEAWHLPARRRVLAIEGATLADATWKYPFFPFVIFRWVERLTGFYGCGLAEELASYQLAVNKTNANIHAAHDVLGAQRVFMHVQDLALRDRAVADDTIGTFVPYRVAPPTVPNWQAVKPEVYSYKESLKADAQRYSGIPDMAARSVKPVGLDSGAALREWTDIQASRLTTQKAAIERLKIEASQIIIAFAKDLYGRNQDVEAFWNSRNLAKKIKWSDVDMEEDMYVLRIEPASMMSRTPAGMRQAVIDLAATGALQPEEILRLMGIPDVQRALDIATAGIEDIEAEIEELYDGIWSAPEPFMDLNLGIQRVQSAYLLARRSGAPQKILDLLQMWIVRARALLESAAPVQPTQPGMATVPFQAGIAAPAGVIAPAPGAPPAAQPAAA